MPAAPPRYAPGWRLPTAAYRPGGDVPKVHIAPPAHLHADAALGRDWFRHGVDLFNHGYWWEAHEVWEALWHGYARGSTGHTVLQGLIMLAAALLQHGVNRPRGAERLWTRAHHRLSAGAPTPPPAVPWAGLDAPALAASYASWWPACPPPGDPGTLANAAPPILLAG